MYSVWLEHSLSESECLLFVWNFQLEMGLAERASAVLRVCGTCVLHEFTERTRGVGERERERVVDYLIEQTVFSDCA